MAAITGRATASIAWTAAPPSPPHDAASTSRTVIGAVHHPQAAARASGTRVVWRAAGVLDVDPRSDVAPHPIGQRAHDVVQHVAVAVDHHVHLLVADGEGVAAVVLGRHRRIVEAVLDDGTIAETLASVAPAEPRVCLATAGRGRHHHCHPRQPQHLRSHAAVTPSALSRFIAPKRPHIPWRNALLLCCTPVAQNAWATGTRFLEAMVRTPCGWKATRKVTSTVLAGALAGSLLGAVGPSPAAVAAPGDPFDLELVIDGSGSIAPPDFDLARLFAKRVVQSCLFSDNAQAGIVQFSDEGDTRVEAPLTSELSLVTDALDLMVQLNGSTDIQEGIDVGQAQLAGGRPVPKFMLLLTDGIQTENGDALVAADAAKAAGTDLYVIGVGPGVDPLQLAAIASDPDSTHVFQVSDFASLEATLGSVVGNVCETTPVEPGRFTPLDNPVRTLDTRYGPGPLGKVAADGVLELPVGGVEGVPSDATGVLLNTTVTDTDGDGFLTVWGCGSPRPTVSNLNYVTGDEVANLVVTKIGAGGRVCLSPGISGTHIVVDVAGYFSNATAAPSATASLYNPIEPARFVDTRTSVPVGGETTFALQVAGVGAVPGDARAVVLNATVTRPDGDGFVTVWPCGVNRPLASNVNYVAGESVPNLVAVRVGAGGQVCFSGNATVDLAVDVMGWFGASGGAYEAVFPQRVADTRDGTGTDFFGPLLPGDIAELPVADADGFLPGLGGTPPTATGVMVNVTAAAPLEDGYLTLWPCGVAQPNVSNVNYVAGQTVPNLVAVKLGAEGKVCYSSYAESDVVIDLVGFFNPA